MSVQPPDRWLYLGRALGILIGLAGSGLAGSGCGASQSEPPDRHGRASAPRSTHAGDPAGRGDRSDYFHREADSIAAEDADRVKTPPPRDDRSRARPPAAQPTQRSYVDQPRLR